MTPSRGAIAATPQLMTAEPGVPGLTATVEDYLKAIYHIEAAGGAASKADVADRMGVASATVTGMVGRLAEQGLVIHERYGPVKLTRIGRRAALRTIRRHRIIETYLTRALGYSWDEVHNEAERLEHSASDLLVDRMATALGDPTSDPHGAPIPTRDGTIDQTVYRTLAAMEIGERARVVRLPEHDAEVLRYLDKLGLRPGSEVFVAAREPFGGPITIQVDSTSRGIAPTLAAEIRVTGPGK